MLLASFAAIVVPAFSAKAPEHVNLQYVQEADSGTSQWVIYPASTHLPEPIRLATNFRAQESGAFPWIPGPRVFRRRTPRRSRATHIHDPRILRASRKAPLSRPASFRARRLRSSGHVSGRLAHRFGASRGRARTIANRQYSPISEGLVLLRFLRDARERRGTQFHSASGKARGSLCTRRNLCPPPRRYVPSEISTANSHSLRRR